MERPATRFAWNGDMALAYQVLGEGGPDLLYVQGWVSNVELNWEHPTMARFLRGLARQRRLIVMDRGHPSDGVDQGGERRVRGHGHLHGRAAVQDDLGPVNDPRRDARYFARIRLLRGLCSSPPCRAPRAAGRYMPNRPRNQLRRADLAHERQPAHFTLA